MSVMGSRGIAIRGTSSDHDSIDISASTSASIHPNYMIPISYEKTYTLSFYTQGQAGTFPYMAVSIFLFTNRGLNTHGAPVVKQYIGDFQCPSTA